MPRQSSKNGVLASTAEQVSIISKNPYFKGYIRVTEREDGDAEVSYVNNGVGKCSENALPTLKCK